MKQNYMPTTDAKFAQFSARVTPMLVAAPTDYGLTTGQATALNTANVEFQDAYSAAINDSTRGKLTIFIKNEKRDFLRAMLRRLCMQLQEFPAVTNDMLVALGLTVRKTTKTKRNVQEQGPIVTLKSLNGRVGTLRVSAANASSRARKGINAEGANLFIFRGATPPTDPTLWTFLAVTTKTEIVIPFDGSAAEQVHVTALWYSASGETSFAGTPLCINLPAAQGMQNQAPMKIAA